MSDSLAKLLQMYPDFANIILNTCLASVIVYNNDPKTYLQTNQELQGIQHELTQVQTSHSWKKQVECFNEQLPEIQYLIAECGSETKKRLIVSFRGTSNLSDILDDLKVYPKLNEYTGRFHNGFYKRSECVPFGYFWHKLKQGYEIIFTGHSLGAAVAAMITIKLLKFLNMTKETAKSILFVGYGCPSIADIYFKDDINNDYKDRFIFIKNRNDIVVELLDYMAIFVYDRPARDKFIEKNLSFIAEFLENILPFSFNHLQDAANRKIIETCKNFSSLTNPLFKLAFPQYAQFGTLVHITDSNQLKLLDKFEINQTKMESLFLNVDQLIVQVQNHFVKNYFNNLKSKVFDQKINFMNAMKIQLINMADFDPPSIRVEHIRSLKDEKNTQISIYLTFDEARYYPILDHLVGAQFVIGNECKIFAKQKLNQFQFCAEFTVANTVLEIPQIIERVSFKLNLYAHLSQKPIEITIDKELILQKILSPDQVSTQKFVEINQMPFDLLYLHAAAYVVLISRMERNEGANESNGKFVQIKNKILEIFKNLDNLWDSEMNERLKTKISLDNESDVDEMKSILRSYLAYNITDYEENNYDFKDILNNITFEYKNDTTLLSSIERLINYRLEENSFDYLVKHLIPRVYEIRKQVCRIANISDHVLKNIHREKYYTSDIFLKFTRYFSLVAMAAVGSWALHVGFKTVATSLGKSAGAAVGTLGAAAVGAVTGVTRTREKQTKETITKDLSHATVAVLNTVQIINNHQLTTAAVTPLQASVTAMATSVAVQVFSDQFEIYHLKYLKSKFVNEKDEEMYKLILKLCKMNLSENLLGTCERNIDDLFIKDYKDKKSENIFKTIQLNGQLRDILCENMLIGVIGTIKAGKSTFIELITNKSANSSPKISTNFATAYASNKTSALIDYPHFGSNIVSQKLELYFTRILLDHVILIIDSTNSGKTEVEKLLYSLVTRNNFKNILILCNKIDELFEERGLQNSDDQKLELIKNLGIGLTDNVDVLLTCLKQDIGDKTNKMVKTGYVLFRRDVERKFYEKIKETIELKLKFTQKDDPILSENYYFASMKLKNFDQCKNDSKKIKLVYRGNGRTTVLKYHLYRGSNNNLTSDDEDEHNPIDSYNNLTADVKNYIFLNKNHRFSIVSDEYKSIDSFDDFFADNFYSYKIILQ